MKTIVSVGLLFVTIYLPLVTGGDIRPTGPTSTPVSTETGTATSQPTQTPNVTVTGSPVAPTSTTTPVSTAQPTATASAEVTPSPTSSLTPTGTATPSSTPQGRSNRRINAPRLSGGAGVEQAAIAWFGRVDNTSNYADIRAFYGDDSLRIFLHIFDRRLWYDASPAATELEQWDAATLYLDTGLSGGQPSGTSHRFVAQLANTQERSAYQAAYRGDSSAWAPAGTDFTTSAGWRGDGLNNGSEARGWSVTFRIPFASLEFSDPPPEGTVWRMALVLHDRDDSTGTAIPVQTWPQQADGQQLSTWGELHFGVPAHAPPPATPDGSTTVRHGLDGAAVVDAHVGGDTVCGDPFAPNYFEGWGDANYAGADQINVQNQWDVADWPCFSKYYVTFPLDSVPAGRTILDAALTMHLFGNSGQGATPAPQPSLLQVLTVSEAWDEASITWNNAPMAAENISAAWVDPVTAFPGWPGVPYTWDVGRAVADAYARGEPLRLALYTADTPIHSGKYFSSSDVDEWNAIARPSLTISWGEAVSN